MSKGKKQFILSGLFFIWVLLAPCGKAEKSPVEYVNPYIGNISHMLVPTYPTVHLPNSMLRVYPEREDYTGNYLNGLPLIVTSHRGSSAFNISPWQGDIQQAKNVIPLSYDNELITPYFYSVDLDETDIAVRYAPSHQSGIYEFEFSSTDTPAYLIFNTREGEITTKGNSIRGYQQLINNTKVYIYFETDIPPIQAGTHIATGINAAQLSTSGENAYLILQYPAGTPQIKARYGISFISTEQAEKNLHREIKEYNVDKIARQGKETWNSTLGKIKIKGIDEEAKTVFYTSLYRTYERMICISEDGYYFSAYDGNVHADNGRPFYTDDWIWDTYRATHPLRTIIEPTMENDMIHSHLVMTRQMENSWMPNFPEVTGDSRRMNSNHGVAMVADAAVKGLNGFDLQEAFRVCKAAITEKTLAPWSGKPAGELDRFYLEHGYFPSLAIGEEETVPEVDGWEKRQAVAVTLGTVYDEWCLSQIAQLIGKKDEADHFSKRSFNYRKIFHPESHFFHPKDVSGKFIEPLDYRFPPGVGAREAYDENNAYIYRWDVQHNIADLIELIGGKKQFIDELEQMYNTPLGMPKYHFYHSYPDHTGNVGQFSMGNEPAMHIPYLYNYAGEPWRTQKRVRNLLTQWFRNDVMGVPGDEDGGGLASFVVFSQLGFYPVTPGLPVYVIGSPVFEQATIHTGNGKTFKVICKNYSPENKYIQSARLNGKELTRSWFSHSELIQGGTLEFVMGKHPNKAWATGENAIPPSFRLTP